MARCHRIAFTLITGTRSSTRLIVLMTGMRSNVLLRRFLNLLAIFLNSNSLNCNIDWNRNQYIICCCYALNKIVKQMLFYSKKFINPVMRLKILNKLRLL